MVDGRVAAVVGVEEVGRAGGRIALVKEVGGVQADVDDGGGVDSLHQVVDRLDIVERHVGVDVSAQRVEQAGEITDATDGEHLRLDGGQDLLLALAAREVGALTVVPVPGSRVLEGGGAAHVLLTRFEADLRVGACVSVARGVLGVDEADGDVDVDASHGVDALLEGGEVEPHEVVDGDAEKVGEGGVRHRAPGVLLAGLDPAVAVEHTVAVGLVDLALVDLLAGRVVHRHVPVAGNRDLGDLRRAGRVRLDRDDHDRVGEVGPVVPGATVAVESDVDPLLVSDLIVLYGGAILSANQAPDDGGHVSVEDVRQTVQDPVAEGAAEGGHHHHDGDDRAPGRHPAGEDAIPRAPEARSRCHLDVFRSGAARRAEARPTVDPADQVPLLERRREWGKVSVASKGKPGPRGRGGPEMAEARLVAAAPAGDGDRRGPRRGLLAAGCRPGAISATAPLAFPWHPPGRSDHRAEPGPSRVLREFRREDCGEMMTTPRQPGNRSTQVPESAQDCASTGRPRTGVTRWR